MGTILPFIGAVKRTSDNTVLRIICGPRIEKRKMNVYRKSSKHYRGDEINDDERGTTRNTHARDEKCVQNFSPNTGRKLGKQALSRLDL